MTEPPPPPAAQRAFAELRDLIVRGRLPPGARVTETEAAERLGISRTPVREALRLLLQQGLVVEIGGARRRMAVAPVSRADVLDLYAAAGVLEGLAGRAGASIPAPERTALAGGLREREARFREAAAAPAQDFDHLFRTHDAFHRLLVDRCASPRTRVLLEVLRPQLDRYEWLYAPLVGRDHTPTFAEHDAVIAAIERGDPAGAEAAVRANWTLGAERLAAAIGRVGAGSAPPFMYT